MNSSAVIFGSIVLILAGLMTRVYDPIARLNVAAVALIFLNLFFYSLLLDKISDLKKKQKEEIPDEKF